MGTLFSHDGARYFQGKHDKPQKDSGKDHSQQNGIAEDGKADTAARDLAIAARDASRVLQNLPTEVGCYLGALGRCDAC